MKKKTNKEEEEEEDRAGREGETIQRNRGMGIRVIRRRKTTQHILISAATLYIVHFSIQTCTCTIVRIWYRNDDNPEAAATRWRRRDNSVPLVTPEQEAQERKERLEYFAKRDEEERRKAAETSDGEEDGEAQKGAAVSEGTKAKDDSETETDGSETETDGSETETDVEVEEKPKKSKKEKPVFWKVDGYYPCILCQ